MRDEIEVIPAGHPRRWSSLAKAFVVGTIILIAIITYLVSVNVRLDAIVAGNKRLAEQAAGTIDDLIAARHQTQVVACQSYNTDTARVVNVLNDRTQEVLAAFNADPRISAEAKAFFADQIARYQAVKAPLRNCTDAGIADYYANPQGPNAYLPSQ